MTALIDLLDVAKTAWTAFYEMAQKNFFTVKGVPISIWDFLIFLAASEVVIWFIHALFAGDKSTGGDGD